MNQARRPDPSFLSAVAESLAGSSPGKYAMATDISIEVAKGLQLRGRLAEAEGIYRELLARQPDTLDALEGLGVLLFQQGRAEEAATLFARAVAIEPQSARFHANLGECLRTVRRFDQALDHLRRAVALSATDVQAWNSLGLLSFDLRRYPAALRAYREAIRLWPRFVHARINVANTLRAMGRPDEATNELREAVRIEPGNPLALLTLVSMLIERGDPRLLAEAETAARSAVNLEPRPPLALTMLAKVLRLEGRLDEAAELDNRAMADGIDGRSSSPLEQRTATDQSAGEHEVAHTSSLPAEGRAAEAQYLLGVAHWTEGRLEEADASFREAIGLDARMSSAWVSLATVQAVRGQIELSCQSARTAIHLRPDLAEAYWRLATNLLGDVPDAEVDAMEKLVPDPSLSNDDRALLHFGLWAVMDRRGFYSRAAALADVANSQQSAAKFARGLIYDSDQYSESIDRIIATFTPEFIARGAGWGVMDMRPVFVVGFPRSGTTLTEQILASHKAVRGAGELPDLGRVFQSLPEIVGDPSCNQFDAIRLLGPESAQVAARRYLDKLDNYSSAGTARIVDKMPDNVNYVGLIALLFPRAKVIVCRRDPRDIALSCWQIGFRTCPWNNDWDRIARRLADYQRVLAHWERTRPHPYLELSYEDAVADPEHHARVLIDFIGLEWDPACLEFNSNPRAVSTPSHAQVRQPIHSRSAGRWRNYEPYIRPLFEAFERHGVIVPQND
jgi:tetratricopeptide (TPR) repeat protein